MTKRADLDAPPLTRKPWVIRRAPNGEGGEFISVVGPVIPCGDPLCSVEHRPCVAWDISLADAQEIVASSETIDMLTRERNEARAELDNLRTRIRTHIQALMDSKVEL